MNEKSKIYFELEKENLRNRIEKLKSEIKYKQNYLNYTEKFLRKLESLDPDKIAVVEV